MKYKVTVTNIGDFALQLMQVRDSIIIFDKDVPYAYANMVVSHTKGDVREDPSIGDQVIVADREYRIVDIGEEAIQNLRERGHVTLVFNEDKKAEMPGEIVLGGDKVPRIMVGDTIEIFWTQRSWIKI